MRKVEDLTLEEKIGQLIVFGFNEKKFSKNILELIRDYKLGNIILFARNISSPKKLFTLNKKIQEAMMEHLGIPAIISVDNEGGMITRIYESATVFPGAMTLAATDNPKNAYLTGLYMADELDALGINVNFAPVLDVNNNPLNPVIGVRSYGDRADQVALYANNFIEGMQTKVYATGKHFPGHGNTSVDSHLDLPIVDLDLDIFADVELAPFKSAIENNIKGIMSAHIVYKNLTHGRPATLSKDALTYLLRDKLGFEGLIFTDGMEMLSMMSKYGAVESAIPALIAGSDLLLYCHHIDQQKDVVELIKKAVLGGTLPMSILDERVRRVLKHKEIFKAPILQNSFNDIKHRIGNYKHREFAQKTVDQALTLVKGREFSRREKTFFIGQMPKSTSFVDFNEGRKGAIKALRKELRSFSYQLVDINPTDREIERLVKRAEKFPQVVLTTYNSNIYSQQIKLIKELLKLDVDLHVISMRNPYDLHLVPEIENYVCLYEYTNNSINTLRDYLLGKLRPTGKLPIK